MPKKSHVAIKRTIEEKLRMIEFEDSKKLTLQDCKHSWARIRCLSLQKWEEISSEKRKTVVFNKFYEQYDGKTFEYNPPLTEKSFNSQIILDEIISLIEASNDPELFDYLLKDIRCSWYPESSNKLFASNTNSYKWFFIQYLLIRIINIAPKNSLASQFRDNLNALVIPGGHGWGTGACYGEQIDLSSISNYKNLESLVIQGAQVIRNWNQLVKISKIKELIVIGSRYSIWTPRFTYYSGCEKYLELELDEKSLKTIKKCKNLSRLELKSIKNIEDVELNSYAEIENFNPLN